MTCARTCATSTSTWTASASLRRRVTASTLDASLITGIDPPGEVESALAAINTAYNQVSSDISLAQAGADQKTGAVQTRGGDRDAQGPGRGRAAQGPGRSVAGTQEERAGALPAYVRNVRLKLFSEARRAILEVPHD